MNKILIQTVVILSITGCQKNDIENLVSFKLDGEQYICNSDASYNESHNWGYPILDVYGEFDFSPDGFHVEYIQITLNPFDETSNEYRIDSGNSIIMHLQSNDGTTYLANAGSGLVIIEELSEARIKGTFNCIATPLDTGSGSITITEGKFDLKME